MHFIMLFLGKIIDKVLYTAQVIFIQKNRAILAALSIGISDFVYLLVVKNVVSDGGLVSTAVVALAGAVGCYLAVKFSDKFSKDKLFINVILSDDKEAIRKFAAYLRARDIACVVADTYNREMDRKTLSLTAYAETKTDSHLISAYIKSSDCKFKRIVKT